MKVDPRKKYKTRNGYPVSNITIDCQRDAHFPVSGFANGEWLTWTTNGKFWSSSAYSEVDLIEVKEKKVVKKTAKKPVKKVVTRKKATKEPMVVSMEKCYETKCGYPARIYATDGSDLYPVHGAYHDGHAWIQDKWMSDGKYSSDGTGSDLNLVEVPKVEVMYKWIAVRDCNGSRHPFFFDHEEEARDYIHGLRGEKWFACKKVEIKCSQGEGL